MNRPIPKSYWVIPGRLLAGTYPGDLDPVLARDKARRLAEHGVSCFLDLLGQVELNPFLPTVTFEATRPGRTVMHQRAPIRDLGVPTHEDLERTLEILESALEAGHVVYVYCWGGVGSTGTVGCHLVERGLGGEAAIEEIAHLRDGMPNADRASPETSEQRELVLHWRARPKSHAVPEHAPSLAERFRGGLLGLAVGDALGTTLEFRAPGSFTPTDDLIGGGPFHLEPGQWTDDTSMALSLAESLIEKAGFDATDQLERYLCWYREGHLSSNGWCFDIGNTVRAALEHFERTRDPRSGPTDPTTAGNGSIMRLAPMVRFWQVVESTSCLVSKGRRLPEVQATSSTTRFQVCNAIAR